MSARAIGHIVVDAHGEGIGFLKNHANAFPQMVYIDITIDIFPVQQNFSRDSAALDQVVHTVQAFEQRGFSAAGRTDKGGDLVGTDTKVDVFQRFEITVVEIQIADRNFIHK